MYKQQNQPRPVYCTQPAIARPRAAIPGRAASPRMSSRALRRVRGSGLGLGDDGAVNSTSSQLPRTDEADDEDEAEITTAAPQTRMAFDLLGDSSDDSNGESDWERDEN
eukprot:1028895-Pleurochrysis_carterae.AAC.1